MVIHYCENCGKPYDCGQSSEECERPEHIATGHCSYECAREHLE